MDYLLIDFGASRIKSILFNSSNNSFRNLKEFPSFFLNSDTLKLNEVKNFIDKIISYYDNIDKIITCSTLGGYYVHGIYYSWKSNNTPKLPQNPKCLIGGLFKSKIYSHHAKSIGCSDFDSKIKVIGRYKGIPVLSSLGDTECAIKSVKLLKNELILNLGTGSQVVTLSKRYSFIPSGRMFLMFKSFFESLNKDFFNDLNEITINEIADSNLECNLNVFEQSYKFSNGGSIQGILETNFTYKNLLASILKSYINQYAEYIDLYNPERVYLIGGISKKLPSIKNYLEVLYPNINFTLNNTSYADTHLGLVNYIKEYEYINNRR